MPYRVTVPRIRPLARTFGTHCNHFLWEELARLNEGATDA